MLDLSIIISNHNTSKYLEANLSSLSHILKNLQYEVIVVDDASSDDSVKMLKNKFPAVKIICNEKNLGYSKSYNKGTKQAIGRYILHLNSDCLLQNNLVQAIKFLDKNPKVGVVGAKIVKINGKLDLPCKRSFPTMANVFFQSVGLSFLFPKSKLFGHYYLSFLDESKIHEVDCLMGAFMLIRKEVIQTIGLLDDRFFIYGEDIDFCLRAKKAGWTIVYYPKIIVKHLHGGTTNKSYFSLLKHSWLFHQAMFLYYNKHFAPKKSLFLNLLVYTGIILRFLSTIFISPFLHL